MPYGGLDTLWKSASKQDMPALVQRPAVQHSWLGGGSRT